MNEIERYLDRDKVKKRSELAVSSGMSESMIYQIKTGKRKANPYHAIKLELGSDGKIHAKKLCPEIFKLLEMIGYKRVSKTVNVINQPLVDKKAIEKTDASHEAVKSEK